MGHGNVPDSKDPNDWSLNMSQLHDTHNDARSKSKKFDMTTDTWYNDKLKKEMSYKTNIVFDQGPTNTCTANAASSAYMYILQRQGSPNADFVPSRLFLYYVARLEPNQYKDRRGIFYSGLSDNPPTQLMTADSGTQVREVLRVMASLGVPEEAKVFKNWPRDQWPFIDIHSWNSIADQDVKTYATPTQRDNNGNLVRDSNGNPIYPDYALPAIAPYSEAFKATSKHLTFHYAHPEQTDIHCWKTCIANGYPIIFGLKEHDDLNDSNGPSFSKSIDLPEHVAVTPTLQNGLKFNGGHAVLAVGWDDDKPDGTGDTGCLRIQNSWGTSSGDGGFFWMPYSWLKMNSPTFVPSPGNPGPMTMIHDPWIMVDAQDGLAVKP